MTENFSRYAHVIVLDEGKVGMLPEHRQRRRINAARRLGRIHVTRKARELGMIADDWQEATAESNWPDDPAALAVRVSARFTARALQDRINNMIVDGIHAQENYGIPAHFLAGQTSAEAFRQWEAPRRAAYEAARHAAIERLTPAMEQLGRLIEDLANPPQYITIDEEHTITADQLEQLPGRMWLTSTANEVEAHQHALEILEELEALLTGLPISSPRRDDANLADVARHHLDALRRLVLHHHDLEDPAGADQRARGGRIARNPSGDHVCESCGMLHYRPALPADPGQTRE